MNVFRGASLKEKNACVHLMEGAEEIPAAEQGITQFVYTHKGLNAHQIFTRLIWFTEIVSQQPTALSASPTQKVSIICSSNKWALMQRRPTIMAIDSPDDVAVSDQKALTSVTRPEINQKIEKLLEYHNYL